MDRLTQSRSSQRHEKNEAPRVIDYLFKDKAGKANEAVDENYHLSEIVSPPQHYPNDNIPEPELFTNFSGELMAFDAKLLDFSTEVRQVGRSFDILIATRKVREQLARIEFVCYENAAHLFPQLRDPLHLGHFRRENEKQFMTRRAASKLLSLDEIPTQMIAFVSALADFRECLDDFREYNDESIKIKDSISSFEVDLKYWASCLQAYKAHFYSKPVQQYIFQLTMEIGNRIAHISFKLKLFIEIGIPAIRYEQKRETKGLINMSTGATFFSAVTATMLQISYSVRHNPTISVVNSFWFCSLVLSIGAALNSLLSMAWRQTIRGSRGNKLPLWVTVWIHASPPSFLIVSIGSFSTGLVLFTYSSQQSPYTSSFTLVATTVTSLGLGIITLWIAYEQLVRRPPPSSQVDGNWNDHTTLSSHSSSVDLSVWSDGGMFDTEVSDDEFSNDPKAVNDTPSLLERTRTILSSINSYREGPSDGDIETQQPIDNPTTSQKLWKIVTSAIEQHQPPFNLLKQYQGHDDTENNATICVVTPVSEPTTANTRQLSEHINSTPDILSCSVDLTEYGVIQHLVFSPDGGYLAVTSWAPQTGKSTTVIYKINCERLTFFKEYEHPGRRLNVQVVWSPTSTHILVRLHRGVAVWTLTRQDVSKPFLIMRDLFVKTLKWYGDEEAFLCMETNTLSKVDLTGKVLWKTSFLGLDLFDVTLTSNSYLVLLGRVLKTKNDLQPSHPRFAEKQILVCHADAGKRATSVPILDAIRHVTATHHVPGILVSFKSGTPPQFWSLKDSDTDNLPHLELGSKYSPRDPEDFEGPSYSGNNDQLVACSGRTGDVHIWERETGLPVHRFKPHDKQFNLNSDSPYIAWNPIPGLPLAATLATGSGTELKLWKYRRPWESNG